MTLARWLTRVALSTAAGVVLAAAVWSAATSHADWTRTPDGER